MIRRNLLSESNTLYKDSEPQCGEEEKLETQEGGKTATPRLYHDFLNLLLFTKISPSRNLDMMRLEICQGQELWRAVPDKNTIKKNL